MRRVAALVLAAGSAAANPNKFEAVAPGGMTTCVRGTPWSFMHRQGTVNKLVIEFEGGGACWNAATCAVADSCTTSVDEAGCLAKLNGANSGIHDGTNPKNPFAEWYHVYIPYCTCDIHTGTSDHRYTVETLHHRGHINFMTALNWTWANFPTTPDVVAVTGCSAGSAGALWNWPIVADRYPKAQHRVFGDSFVGVLSEKQYNEAYPNWGMTVDRNIPGWEPSKISTWFPDMSCYLQRTASAVYPTVDIGVYTSNADAVQTHFYELGEGRGSWTQAMRNETTCYLANVAPMHVFIAAGDAHCRSQDDGFYTVQSDGTNLAQWASAIVAGQPAERNVDCASDKECSPAARPQPLSWAEWSRARP